MASTSTSGRGERKRDPFLALETPNNNKIKSLLTAKQFDVFINHRGPDTKTNLARQLYDSLQDAGIRAYLDAPETELGDYFPSAIKNAIFSAAVHIAILSPRYAESAWCLAELALMFQTKARIIPLFYHVPPSDFRYIKNEVADAFSKHEEKGGRYSKDGIQQWKECLQNVSWLKGYEFKGQDNLSKLCNDVLSAVVNEKQKRKIPFHVAKYAVGLDELVKDFNSHCQKNGQMRDKIIGIFGMGGSGKTTLAKDLFNCKHSEFIKSTIQFDVRENDVKGKLTSLQSKLLNDLFPMEEENKIPSIEYGIAVIKDKLERNPESRFLLVIDDVDHQKQLDALVHIDALNKDSLVIVTTRDERLLIQAGVRVRYKMKELNPEHSRELFCWHAFHRQSCKSGFDSLVDSFVETCGGLPLALQVMGGHVYGSDRAYWRLQLDVVKARLTTVHKDIKATLKISYDALENDQKQIFVDIACFFLGKDVRRAIGIWKASGWRAEHALQTLKDKCLVEVQTCVDGKRPHMLCHYEPSCVLRMHDHLRDFGREMADNEMSWPCRLWRPEDLIEMRKIIVAGSKGISVRCPILLHGIGFYVEYFLESLKTSIDFVEESTPLQNLRILSLEVSKGNGLWMPDTSYSYHQFIPEWIPLQDLHTLRLGGVSPARLLQRDGQVPRKLKELHCSLEGYYCMTNSTRDMVIRDLNESVSSFGMFKHLESLYLKFGPQSKKLNIEWNCFLKSLRELTNLQNLELKCFKVEGEFALSNRGETTDERFCMRRLEAITLCAALKTTKVSVSGQICPTLKSLKLCSMQDLIEVNLTGLTTLECLVLFNCRELRKVLANDLLQLEIFRIKLCWNMREFPNFGYLTCLKRIYISRCRTLQDLSALERLKGLKRIWIAYCPELKSIKAIQQLKGLKRIWIEECPQLHGEICFKELEELKRIFIGRCARLQNIQGIEFLRNLESIIITACPKLQNIRGIEELKGLKEMIIADSPTITCVERLQRLPSEITSLVGRSDMPLDHADVFRDALSTADAFCEINGMYPYSRERVEETIHSFQKSHHSFSTFIFCAIVWSSVCIGSDICNGTRIMLQNLRPINFCFDNKFKSLIFTCVVNEHRLSIYDSWMPSNYKTQNWYSGYLMGVKSGEESKSLHMLKKLFAQLCVDNCFAKDLLPFECGNPSDFDERYIKYNEGIDTEDEYGRKYGRLEYRFDYDDLGGYADSGDYNDM